MIKMKQEDEIFNTTEIHNYISNQVERFTTLGETLLAPFVQEVTKKIDTFSEAELIRFMDIVKGSGMLKEELNYGFKGKIIRSYSRQKLYVFFYGE